MQDTECRVGFPVIVFATNGFRDHANHIADAIAAGKPSTLTLDSRDKDDGSEQAWYNKYQPCNRASRTLYEDSNGSRGACDEYPFGSTLQGGETKYNSGLGSLRLVNLKESERQGRFIGQFYSSANLQRPMQFGNPFGVIALRHYLPPSGWFNSSGIYRIWGYGFSGKLFK